MGEDQSLDFPGDSSCGLLTFLSVISDEEDLSLAFSGDNSCGLGGLEALDGPVSGLSRG